MIGSNVIGFLSACLSVVTVIFAGAGIPGGFTGVKIVLLIFTLLAINILHMFCGTYLAVKHFIYGPEPLALPRDIVDHI